MYNEAGAGLQLSFKRGGDSHILAAGAWAKFEIEPAESEIDFTVLYVIPNAGVNLLLIVYFAPNEAKIPIAVLGNSPLVIGG